MERRGHSGQSWKAVCCLLPIILMGFVSVAGFIVVFFFAFCNWNRDTIWTDIPVRMVAFAICYYVAGVYGYLPIPKKCRASWLPQFIVALRRLQLWVNFILHFYLLRRLVPPTNTSETLLLRDRNEELFADCPPGPSGTTTVNGNKYEFRRFPSDNRNSNGSFGNSSVVSPSLPQYINEDQLDDCPLTVPGPARTTTSCDQEISGKNRITEDISPISNNPFMSFDSPMGSYSVPMVKGTLNKPQCIPDSSISNSRLQNDPDGVSQDAADHEQDLSKPQKNSIAADAVKKKVVLIPIDETNTPPKASLSDFSRVQLSDYPRLLLKWLSSNGKVPHATAKICYKNLQAEGKETYQQNYKANKESQEEEMEDLQSVPMPAQKESDKEWMSDNSNPLGCPTVRILSLPPKRKIHSPDGSRTSPGNFSRRGQFVLVHNRSASDRSHPLAEPNTCIETAKIEGMECCQDSTSLHVILDHVTPLMKLDSKSQSAAGMSEPRQNACLEVEEPTHKNLDLSSVRGGSTGIQQSDKTDVGISAPKPDEPKSISDDSDQIRD